MTLVAILVLSANGFAFAMCCYELISTGRVRHGHDVRADFTDGEVVFLLAFTASNALCAVFTLFPLVGGASL